MFHNRGVLKLNIIKQVEERLAILGNLYDVLRIIDPVNKQTIAIKENEELEFEGNCYCFWKKNVHCHNCISMRAYLEEKAFVKIEYNEGRICMVTSYPLAIKDNKYAIEIVKDISEDRYIKDKNINNPEEAKGLIALMNEKVIKDELTGLYNRRYINERLLADLGNNNNENSLLVLVMVDIDYFSSINNRYGHPIGDRVLIDFARLLQNSIERSKSWVGRYEGDKFLMVLNNASPKEAYDLAEKIRQKLDSTFFSYDTIHIHITSSFGVYRVADRKQDIQSLIWKVDRNLHEAKSSGRNKTFTAD
jgi:two-component system, cell cycle response regulator